MTRRRSFGFWVGYVMGFREGRVKAAEAAYQRGWYAALSRPRVVAEAARKLQEAKRDT